MFKPLSIFDNNSGFTLVELLVAIAIMGAVMAIATTMIVQSFNVFRSSTYRMSAGQMAEMAVNQASLYLRSAVGSEVDDNFGCLYEDGLNGDDEVDEIQFRAYHPDHEGKINIVFELDDNDLRIKPYFDSNEFGLIAYGIKKFCIKEKPDSENEFYLEIQYTDHESNEKTKRTNVKSRNM